MRRLVEDRTERAVNTKMDYDSIDQKSNTTKEGRCLPRGRTVMLRRATLHRSNCILGRIGGLDGIDPSAL